MNPGRVVAVTFCSAVLQDDAREFRDAGLDTANLCAGENGVHFRNSNAVATG